MRARRTDRKFTFWSRPTAKSASRQAGAECFAAEGDEGKQPSCLHEVVYLLIGPTWQLLLTNKKIGLRYRSGAGL
jgi:hypothetical protein